MFFHTRKTKQPPLLLAVVIVIITLPMLLPILYILQYGITLDIHQTYHLIFRAETFLLLRNTLLLCFTVTLISVLLGGLCAFLLERCQVRGKNLLSVLISLPLCIPGIVSGFTWFSLNTRIFSGFLGASLVMMLVSFPLAFLPISAALKRIDSTWEEVSYSLGRSRFYTFLHVLLPQLKPAIGSAVLLIALHLLIEFGVIAIMGYDTFSTAIFAEFEAYYNTQTAAVLCFVLVLLCLCIIGFELKIRGQANRVRSGKGVVHPPKLIYLGYGEWFVIGFVSLIFILGVVVPVIVLCQWIYEGTAIHSEYFSWKTYFNVIADTIFISLISAAITVLVASPLVWFSVRYSSFLSRWLERLPFILHAIPSIVVGLAIARYTVLYAGIFYQTYYVLIPAYLMLYLPLAQTTLRSAVEQLPYHIEEVSDSLGQKRATLLMRVILPSVRPGVIAGLALCFLQMMKELTATLILSPAGMSTIAIEIWHAQEGLSYSIVAVYGLSLILFSGIPVYLLKRHYSG
ncbi:ABC transporter permease [Proteus vulgaris]|uniref:ABC transporter permease n=1 Tax=Proteus vulgaris TaxID=585 RepID=UPI0034E52965